MDCEKDCFWNYNGICVYEDELKYDDGKPGIGIKCPNFLRKDFEQHLHKTHCKIVHLLKKRTCAELEEIEKFIINQREEKK